MTIAVDTPLLAAALSNYPFDPPTFSRHLDVVVPDLEVESTGPDCIVCAGVHTPSSWIMTLFDSYASESATPGYRIASTVEREFTSHESNPDDAPAFRSRAFSAFKDIGAWMSIDDADVASLVGIRRTTPYSWEREGREPRASTIRRLLQLHSALAAVVDRLGVYGAQRWMNSGSPRPFEMIQSGDFDTFNAAAGVVVFTRSQRSFPPGAFMPDEDEDLPPSVRAERYMT